MNNELITSVIAFALFMILIFFFAITLAVRYRQRKRENETLKIQFTQERLKIQIEIQEETLAHISRELHDNFGQLASLIKINLSTIQLPAGPAARHVEDTLELTRQLIGDIKLLSVSLSNDRIAQKGLASALETEAERLRRTGLYDVTLTIEDALPAADKDKTLILYRMIQEILGNIMKHSKATQIGISLRHVHNETIIEITDNGTGFDIQKALAGDGAGLRNLYTRAELIGASIKIDGQSGQGTTAIITLPHIP